MSSLDPDTQSELESAAEEALPLGAAKMADPIRGTGALVAAGSAWVVLQTLANKVVMLLGQLVLAWLLDRDDFGKIGLAYTVTAFVTLFTNPGIDVILVRRGRKFQLWSTPAFYFSLTTGILGCLIILAVAPFVAQMYRVPQLTSLLAILAVATPLGSIALVPTAKLRWEMKFRTLALVNLIQTTLKMALTVAFAAVGFGVYAFVLPMPIVYIVAAVMLWWSARPVIRLRNPFRHWRYLIGDSLYIFGNDVLITATWQGDYFVLGRMYDPAVVGPYFFAFGIAVQAIRLTAGSMQLVLMAGLSRMAQYSVQQTQAAVRATKAVALVGMPLCFVQAAVAGPVLHALYGAKWDSAIPLVQWISVGMAFGIVSWPAGGLLQSRGQFRFFFHAQVVFFSCFMVLVYFGALWGAALGTAIAVCIFHTISNPVFAACVFRSSGVGWRDILDMNLRPLAVGLLSGAVSVVTIHYLDAAGVHPIVQSAVAVVAGIVVMVVSARLIMSSSWHDIIARLRAALRSQLPSNA